MKRFYIYVIFMTQSLYGMVNKLNPNLVDKIKKYIIKNDKKELFPFLNEKKNDKKKLFLFLNEKKNEIRAILREDRDFFRWAIKATNNVDVLRFLLDNGAYTDRDFFRWAIKATNNVIVLQFLIDYGIYTDPSCEQTVKDIGMAAGLVNCFSAYNDENLLEYLKKEEIKEYLKRQKKVFVWAASQTKDPFMLKHLVDHGVNLDNHMSSDKNNIFYFLVKKLHCHHYDLLFALIARHISEENSHNDITFLAEKLSTFYKKLVPSFYHKIPKYYTIFEIASNYQKNRTTEIHALINRGLAIKILDPNLWTGESQQKKDLINKIFDYRKRHGYDQFPIFASMQDNKTKNKHEELDRKPPTQVRARGLLSISLKDNKDNRIDELSEEK